MLCGQRSTHKESSLRSMVQVLRENTEYQAIHLVEVLGKIVDAILPQGESKEEEVKTHWVPGTPPDIVMQYHITEP